MIKDKLFNEYEILVLIKQGSQSAFAQLFGHFQDRIYSIAYKLTHSTTLAEEIVADVFLKVWIRRDKIDEIQNFSAYLFIIVRNTAYKVLKENAKNYKVSELTNLILAPVNDGAECYLMEKEYSSLLRRAINQLPNQQKRVYQLIKEHDMKREAVANILDIQPETVKFHLAQAMKSVRAFCLLHLKIMIIYFYFNPNV